MNKDIKISLLDVGVILDPEDEIKQEKIISN